MFLCNTRLPRFLSQFHHHAHLHLLSSSFSQSQPKKTTQPSFLSSSSQWRSHCNLTASVIGKLSLEDDTVSSSYLSARIWCRKDIAGLLSDALLCFGASSASIDDGDGDPDDAKICVTSFFEECQDVAGCISHAADSIGMKETPSYEVINGKEQDWVKIVEDMFHPVEVTNGLWIIPEWRTPVMGAALAVGVDIDPQAITSAHRNAALNNIEPDQMHFYQSKFKVPMPSSVGIENAMGENPCDGDIMAETAKYDIVIANLLLNPLRDLASHITAYAKPGAFIGLSGVLSEQVAQIREIYSSFLDNISVSEIDGWACIRGIRTPDQPC
ncbi:uncharacterized protein LOC18445037 isoform X2 [Amborella trichopoda]|uniref:uncharacterized protein LOC18445037 isoform X2 n=1 Tax=Amborella trichopoda TaxID=13333 RepID=UPI0009C0253B|nr:uncharacterized protein LOC18445037 isoform X2 [Amborella trichopoda]|eukprot:XP_020529681.1 uncharacterized protein LOC18445037 isoform X2 [Amborella trichopoda]